MKTRHFSWRAACTCLSVATTFVLKMEIRRQKEKALGSFTAAETKKSDRFRVGQFFSCGCADGAWTVRSRVSGCERMESGTCRLRADIWRTCDGRVANAGGGVSSMRRETSDCCWQRVLGCLLPARSY